MALLDPPRLLGGVVIIRECLVDIRDIRGIPFSNSFKGESILLYAHIHIVNDDGFPLCGSP